MGRVASADAAAFNTLISSDVTFPAYFVKLKFSSGDVNLWTGSSNFSFLGETYLGTGTLGQISSVDESSGLSAKGVTLSLVGQGSGIYEEAMNEGRRSKGKPVFIWAAWFTDATFSTILYYQLQNEYRMDELKIQDVVSSNGNGGIMLSMGCESELTDLFSSSRARLTDPDQRALFSNDTFFRFVSTLPGKDIPWGKANKTREGNGPGSTSSNDPNNRNRHNA